MLVVIDANIVLAAMINPEGANGSLLFSPELELISPEFIKEELLKYLGLVVSKTGRSELDVKLAFDLILSQIKILSSLEYDSYRKQAEEISPDKNDSEYFSVALASNCAFWSNDKQLKAQSVVRVLSTFDLLQLV